MDWSLQCFPRGGNHMKRTSVALALVALVVALGAEAAAGGHKKEPPPPAGVLRLDLADGPLTLWPFTGTDLAGTASDPINLIFVGDADPRQVRQALMALDGDRTAYGFPDAFPFNCTWSDAIGRHQAAWAAADGWQGSAVQLQCGVYGPLRFHLRLFREGKRTLGNVHFEVLIPGTTDHEVLTWEFAEAFVKLDMSRSQALTALAETPSINPAPTYRTIRYQVYNGLPVALRGALGLPLADQTAPIPIPTNGKATVLALSQPLEHERSDVRLEYDQPFDQVIPKPFCAAGPLDYLKVKGPLHFVHRVKTSRSGRYTATFSAPGILDVVPVNPLSGEATGAAFKALVSERHRSEMLRRESQAEHFVLQTLLTNPSQSFFEHLSAGDVDRFARLTECGSDAP